MGGSDTFNYSMAILNSVLLAVLTFFYPLSPSSKLWALIVAWLLLTFSSILFLKKDELKGGGSFNTMVGLALAYIMEVAVIALLPLMLFGRDPSAVFTKPSDAAELERFAGCYVYFLLFFYHLQNDVLAMLAGEQGRRVGVLVVASMVLAFAFGAVYCVSYFQMLGPDFQLPTWVQSVGFLLLVPGLLRLRQLESYGHI